LAARHHEWDSDRETERYGARLRELIAATDGSVEQKLAALKLAMNEFSEGRFRLP
jgi:hypothetical protein